MKQNLQTAVIGALGGMLVMVIMAQAPMAIRSDGIQFTDGTVQSTAAGNCFNPADPDDEMIRVGGVCIDKYEGSIWSEPDGGIQYGVDNDDYPCSDNGQDCDNIYARSVGGVAPSRFITWFQAQRALVNSGKRLPTNAEWQMAVSGTPDPGTGGGSEDCHVNNAPSFPEFTGERSNCVSAFGHHDMIGNLWEWTGDWNDDPKNCDTWPPGYGDDFTCFGLGEGEVNSNFPAALLRGGSWIDGAKAGAFAVTGTAPVSILENGGVGVRGAR